MVLRSIDPVTGQEIAAFEVMTPQEVDHILTGCEQAAKHWSRHTSYAQRADHLLRVAKILRERKDELALLMAREMGKPLPQGTGEVEKCAWVCEHYAQHAEGYLQPQEVAAGFHRSYVAFQPLGVVLAVMPWNFPLWQVFRFAAPALMAGNGALLKHASNVTGCALAIESTFQAAGLPDHLFRALVVDTEQVEALLGDGRVAAATLTGSVRAGRAVAACAGHHLKKVVLELGGSDPYLVLEDAPLGPTVESCVASRLINSGQSCIAAKRFIVVGEQVQAFTEAMVESMQRKKMGPPTEAGADLGPQARTDLRDALHKQVEDSIKAGAQCLLGGTVPPGPGAFYPPTVLTNVGPGMAAYNEELFGPVAAIISVASEAEAIQVANDTCFGLGAAVFTADRERGERLARDELQAGCCFVNDFVKSDPRLPFGGIKQSGFGRELGAFGIQEFVNIKTVVVA